MSKYSKLPEESTIQRCPHDRENLADSFSVRKDIINNEFLSFEARCLITYLLSFEAEGKFFESPEVQEDLKIQITKKKLRSLISECRKSGYLTGREYD